MPHSRREIRAWREYWQLNRLAPDGKENQLAQWNRLGLFADALPKPPENMPAFPDWKACATQTHEEPNKRPIEIGTDDDVAHRARAYLDVHCAVCHAPQGTGYTKIDLRYSTPAKSMGLVNEDAERPRPGHTKVKLISPGKPADSELLQWIHAKGPRLMPPLGRTIVDDDAVAVISRWIADMEPEPAKSP